MANIRKSQSFGYLFHYAHSDKKHNTENIAKIVEQYSLFSVIMNTTSKEVRV